MLPRPRTLRFFDPPPPLSLSLRPRQSLLFVCFFAWFMLCRCLRSGSTSGTDDGLLRAWALYWAGTRPDCPSFCGHAEVCGLVDRWGSTLRDWRCRSRGIPVRPSSTWNRAFFIPPIDHLHQQFVAASNSRVFVLPQPKRGLLLRASFFAPSRPPPKIRPYKRIPAAFPNFVKHNLPPPSRRTLLLQGGSARSPRLDTHASGAYP